MILAAAVVQLVVLEGAGAAGTTAAPAGALVGDVIEFAVSSDSSRVVYRADQDSDGVVEL